MLPSLTSLGRTNPFWHIYPPGLIAHHLMWPCRWKGLIKSAGQAAAPDWCGKRPRREAASEERASEAVLFSARAHWNEWAVNKEAHTQRYTPACWWSAACSSLSVSASFWLPWCNLPKDANRLEPFCSVGFVQRVYVGVRFPHVTEWPLAPGVAASRSLRSPHPRLGDTWLWCPVITRAPPPSASSLYGDASACTPACTLWGRNSGPTLEHHLVADSLVWAWSRSWRRQLSAMAHMLASPPPREAFPDCVKDTHVVEGWRPISAGSFTHSYSVCVCVFVGLLTEMWTGSVCSFFPSCHRVHTHIHTRACAAGFGSFMYFPNICAASVKPFALIFL